MARSKRVVEETVWESKGKDCKVVFGKLKPTDTRQKLDNLFLFVGEKLPFECLPAVKKKHFGKSDHRNGVYMAHDSFGVPRYGGRGRVFQRLATHKKNYPKELAYFSFYIVNNKSHERELENAILRAAGPQMIINKRKVRDDAKPGSVRDYEPGTQFFQRKDNGTQKKRKRRTTRRTH